MCKKTVQRTTIFTKKKKILPVHCVCRNCETVVLSRYCHNCGQDIFAGRARTIREITENALDTVFAFDNKILRTLKYLLFFPGKLTKEFYAGKVVRYVYPAKLFWFTTLLFFTLLALTVHIDDEDDGEFTVETTEIQASKDTEKEVRGSQMELVREKQRNRDTINRFMSYTPYCMLVLVPVFAFLLFVFFYKNNKYYAHHLVFSMHFHSFTFIYLSLLEIVAEFTVGEELGFLTYAGVPTVYFLIALYVVYRPRKRNMLWKAPVIMLLYGVFALAATVALVLISYVITTGGFQHLADIFSD